MQSRTGISATVAAMLAGLALCAPASAAPSQPALTTTAAMQLDNGDYLWRDDVPELGDVAIVISLPKQRMLVYRGATLIGATTISTGKPGKSTPTGEFTILQKAVFHRSNLYSDAPMPFMQRLTWGGVAMHAGHMPGYPASHGCIRMPRAFAKRLYSLTSLDTPVLVTDQTAPEAASPVDPPVLAAAAGDYASERFNIVTADSVAYSGPGQPVYAPVKAVIQPIDTASR